ncbi:hypothetical protein LCGC14_2926200, partial [marine sediment metagenome]
IEGKNIGKDGVLVTHDKAVENILIENTGNSVLVLFKFFGPDINDDVPFLKRYGPK